MEPSDAVHNVPHLGHGVTRHHTPPRITMTGTQARANRGYLGWSSRQLAEELEMNESSVYRYEWRRDELVPRHYAWAMMGLLSGELKRRLLGQDKQG
jgi:hypothetical protein